MNECTSISEFLTIDEPVEIKQTESLGDIFLSGIESLFKLGFSSICAEAIDRFSKQECGRGIQCKAEKKRLKIHNAGGRRYRIHKIIHMLPEDFKVLILLMSELRSQ